MFFVLYAYLESLQLRHSSLQDLKLLERKIQLYREFLSCEYGYVLFINSVSIYEIVSNFQIG